MALASLRIHQVSSALVTLVALVHTGLTPFLYSGWSSNAVWFAGTGLALLLLGGANIAARKDHAAGASREFCRAANFGFLAFAVVAVVAVPEPQAFLLLASLAGQAFAGLSVLRRPA